MIKLFGHIIYNNGLFGGEATYGLESTTTNECECGVRSVTHKSTDTRTILSKIRSKVIFSKFYLRKFQDGVSLRRKIKYYTLLPLLSENEHDLLFNCWDELEMWNCRGAVDDIVLSKSELITLRNGGFHRKYTKSTEGGIQTSFPQSSSSGWISYDGLTGERVVKTYTKEEIEESERLVKIALAKWDNDVEDYKTIRKLIFDIADNQNGHTAISHIVVSEINKCDKHGNLMENKNYEISAFLNDKEEKWWSRKMFGTFNLPIGIKIPFDEIVKINH